jgi:hypothetical protein
MMADDDSSLHALAVEPRVARPGDTVLVRFRTRNLGERATPEAIVSFELDAALEPLDALDVVLAPVEAGADLVAEIRVRVARGADDGERPSVRALLRLPDRDLATNRCAVRVHGSALLDGAQSGTFIELLDPCTVRVRAEVRNDGDAIARDVVLALPVPVGCAGVDTEHGAERRIERIAPGEQVELAFTARIVSPIDELVADGAEVRLADGTRHPLTVRERIVPQPAIVPAVRLDVVRGGATIHGELRNEGWVEARDVRAEIALPASMHIVEGGVAVDGVRIERSAARRRNAARSAVAFASAASRAGVVTVAVDAIPARTARRIAVQTTYPRGARAGAVSLSAGELTAEAAFVPLVSRELRVDAAGGPRTCAPGERVALWVKILNAGDVAETVRVGLAPLAGSAGADVMTVCRIAPAQVARAVVHADVRDDARDGTMARWTLLGAADDGAPLRCEIAVPVRERLATPPAFPETMLDEPTAACVDASVHAPVRAVAGAPFPVRIVAVAADAVDELILALELPEDVAYVAGSTRIDGVAVLDRAGGSPLCGHGLVMRGVPPGTRLVASCALIAAVTLESEPRRLCARIAVNGDVREVVSEALDVDAPDLFAVKPRGLAYHLDERAAPALFDDSTLPSLNDRPAAVCEEPTRGTIAAPEPACDAPGDAAPSTAQPFAATSNEMNEDGFFGLALPAFSALGMPPLHDEPRAVTFALALDDARLAAVERALRGDAARLVEHLGVIRALFPDVETSGDERVAAALDAAREAIAAVYDRLYVKLRIPGFETELGDIEDAPMRRAVVRLFETLQGTGGTCIPAPARSPDDGTLAKTAYVMLVPSRVRGIIASFADAPYGAPAALRAILELVPVRSDDDEHVERAFGRYVRALDEALGRYDGAPPFTFEKALQHRAGYALDDAREALRDALQQRRDSLAGRAERSAQW